MNLIEEYNPKIMGVVNVTPDSFSDGGDFLDTKKAIEHGLRLVKEGADILDIGGESTRPGAREISSSEEISRVLPVIEGLRKQTDILISIDTRRSEVMWEAVKVGASMVNDVTALTFDPKSLDVIVNSRVEVCLMHMQGEPGTMQSDPKYVNVVKEIYDYLAERLVVCARAGIKKQSIYVDVGIGFGKTLDHNLELLRNLSEFKKLGTKIVLGTSRKSFIEKIMQIGTEPKDRLAGSLASLVPALEAQVDVLRVHDVAETRQFIEVYKKVT